MSANANPGTGTTQPGTQTPPAGAQPEGGQKPDTQAKPDQKKPETQAKPEQNAQPDEMDLAGGDDTEGTDGSGATATEIELTVPDGVEVDKEMLTNFKEIAKSAKMDSKSAQKVLDLYVGSVKTAEEQILSNWNKVKSDWKDAASKDKEYGGANFKENFKIAQDVINKLGGPALKNALRDLDIGTHPEIIRFAYRVGKALSEDSLSDVGGKPVAQSDEDAMYRKAFPSMYGEKKSE